MKLSTRRIELPKRVASKAICYIGNWGTINFFLRLNMWRSLLFLGKLSVHDRNKRFSQSSYTAHQKVQNEQLHKEKLYCLTICRIVRLFIAKFQYKGTHNRHHPRCLVQPASLHAACLLQLFSLAQMIWRDPHRWFCWSERCTKLVVLTEEWYCRLWL